jgi:hypothetical protein
MIATADVYGCIRERLTFMLPDVYKCDDALWAEPPNRFDDRSAYMRFNRMPDDYSVYLLLVCKMRGLFGGARRNHPEAI